MGEDGAPKPILDYEPPPADEAPRPRSLSWAILVGLVEGWLAICGLTLLVRLLDPGPLSRLASTAVIILINGTGLWVGIRAAWRRWRG